MSHEVLGHTADAKFRATGDTLSDAFESATRAFAEIVGSDELEPTDELRVEVETPDEDIEALLFDYLARLIYLQDVNGVAIVDGDVNATAEPPRVEGTLHVAPVRTSSGLLDIKAPTYNEMVAEEDDGWTLEAVLDI
ncbi:MAG: archease [Halobacteriales archaeon]